MKKVISVCAIFAIIGLGSFAFHRMKLSKKSSESSANQNTSLSAQMVKYRNLVVNYSPPENGEDNLTQILKMYNLTNSTRELYEQARLKYDRGIPHTLNRDIEKVDNELVELYGKALNKLEWIVNRNYTKPKNLSMYIYYDDIYRELLDLKSIDHSLSNNDRTMFAYLNKHSYNFSYEKSLSYRIRVSNGFTYDPTDGTTPIHMRIRPTDAR